MGRPLMHGRLCRASKEGVGSMIPFIGRKKRTRNLWGCQSQPPRGLAPVVNGAESGGGGGGLSTPRGAARALKTEDQGLDALGSVARPTLGLTTERVKG